MTQQTWTEKLKAEGFPHIHIAKFAANTDLGQHTHDTRTVRIVLAGEITITDEKGSTTVIEGDRFDIPPGTPHAVQVGPDGCTMLIGNE